MLLFVNLSKTVIISNRDSASVRKTDLGTEHGVCNNEAKGNLKWIMLIWTIYVSNDQASSFRSGPPIFHFDVHFPTGFGKVKQAQ